MHARHVHYPSLSTMQDCLSASQQRYHFDIITSVDEKTLGTILLRLWILKSKAKEGCQPLKSPCAEIY